MSTPIGSPKLQMRVGISSCACSLFRVSTFPNGRYSVVPAARPVARFVAEIPEVGTWGLLGCMYSVDLGRFSFAHPETRKRSTLRLTPVR